MTEVELLQRMVGTMAMLYQEQRPRLVEVVLHPDDMREVKRSCKERDAGDFSLPGIRLRENDFVPKGDPIAILSDGSITAMGRLKEAE